LAAKMETEAVEFMAGTGVDRRSGSMRDNGPPTTTRMLRLRDAPRG
jgi:hypothetical protein